MYLKKIIFVVTVSVLSFGLVTFANQKNNKPKLSDEFAGLILNNSYPVSLDKDVFSGEGAEKLLNEAKVHDFFMFGENHGALEISKTARLVYEQLNKAKPRLLVSEVSPIAAEFSEKLSREGCFYKYFSNAINLQTLPFFTLTEEAKLLDFACKSNANKKRCFIGLDQEFIASYPLVNDYLKTRDLSLEELMIFETLEFDNFINPFLFGMGSGNDLKELKEKAENINSDYMVILADELIFTHKLYQSNMNGDYKWSNENRETLMMTNFIRQVEQLYPNEVPAMFFKFGGYHLFKGESPTVEKPLGARLDEWAKSRGISIVSVFVDGMEGEVTNGLTGFSTDIKSLTNWKTSPFANALEDNQAVLFDLRPLKGHLDVKKLSKNKQRLIGGYDYFLFYKNVQPVGSIDGTYITRTYGGVALLLGLSVLALIIWMLIKLLKKWRGKKGA